MDRSVAMTLTTSQHDIAVSARPLGASVQAEQQYSLARILAIWALAAIPMGILGWIVFPALAPNFRSDPLGTGVTRVVLLTVGLIWQFVLSMIIVGQETGSLRWPTVKRRLRLNAPQDPHTHKPRARLWLWAIPLIVAIVVWEMALGPYATRAWSTMFSFLA